MDNIWKIVLATVVIFGAGVGTGGLLVNHVDRAQMVTQRRIPDRAPPLWPSPRGMLQGRQPPVEQQRLDERRADFLLNVSRQLNLSPSQSTNIEKIIRDGQLRTTAIWTNVSPALYKEMEAVIASVHNELNPDQSKRFDELLTQGPRRRPEMEGMTNRGSRGFRGSGSPSGAPRNQRFPGRSNAPAADDIKRD